MNRQTIICVTTLAIAGSAAAFFAPNAGVDYSSPPPPHAEVEAALRASKVTLIQAVQTAEKQIGGIASSAVVDLNAEPPTIEVIVYAKDGAREVTVNSSSGEVVANEPHSRFPGEPVTGEPVTDASGLTYYVLEEGSGAPPSSRDARVEAEMTVWLVDGTVIFTSKGQAQPLQFPLNRYPVRGVVSALSEMKVGEMRKLLIPSDLAFGPQSQGTIPAGAMLVVDVKLLADFSTAPSMLPGEPVKGEPVKTASGLMYYDIVPGSGAQPSGPNATVKVHYTGWLVNGKKFDSSVDRGEPVEFPLSGVIPGWTEGVGSMKVGGKRKLIIPADLGYGLRGQPPNIPGGATLIFDVELLDVVNEPAPENGGDPMAPGNSGR